MSKFIEYYKKAKKKSILEIASIIWFKIYYRIVLLIYAIFRLLPVDKKMISFSSEGDYCDNSWALYQYIKDRYLSYHFVWLTLQDKIYNKDKRTLFVYFPHGFTIKSAWYIARSKYIFFTHGLGDDLKPRKGQIVFNLWHGIPFKGIKGGVANSKRKPTFNYLSYSGPMNKKQMAMFLRCDEKYLVQLGMPRFDLLIDNKDFGYNNPFVPNDFKGKVVIWMPTFRKSINKSLSEDIETSTGLPLLNTTEDIRELNEYLKERNVIIILKIHHLQAEEPTFKLKFSNLLFIKDNMLAEKGIQLYQMLGKTDALISDYSSVGIDYLLVDKPMGFILNDMNDYEKSRGTFLYSDIKDILAGTYIYTIKDFHNFIDEISQGIDSTKEKRDKLLPNMIANSDDHNCERICNFCGIKE